MARLTELSTWDASFRSEQELNNKKAALRKLIVEFDDKTRENRGVK